MRQRQPWDCGVCCVAMALGITWEEAKAKLPEPLNGGHYPGEVAEAVGTKARRGSEWRGSLDRCIVQVSLDKTRLPHHFVWVDGEVHDPAGLVSDLSRVTVGMVIPMVP